MKQENEKLYLLRLWQDPKSNIWHASLQNMRNKEVQYFHTLESYVRHTQSIKQNLTGMGEKK